MKGLEGIILSGIAALSFNLFSDIYAGEDAKKTSAQNEGSAKNEELEKKIQSAVRLAKDGKNEEAANQYFGIDRYKEADEQYKLAIERLDEKRPVKEKALLYVRRGFCLGEIGKYDDSLECYKKAVEMKAPFTLVSHRGESASQKKYTEALKFRNSDHKKCIELLKEALAEDPTDPGIYNSISIEYTQLKDYENAISYSKKAIKIDPFYAYPYGGLGTIFYENMANNAKESIYFHNLFLTVYPNYKNKALIVSRIEEAKKLLK